MLIAHNLPSESISIFDIAATLVFVSIALELETLVINDLR